MAAPSEKLPAKTRIILYASLLLVSATLIATDTAAGFFKGFLGGFLIAVIIGELTLYLKRRAAK
ncbi:hypothetical protein H9Q13_14510 [Pontibacter sp. JH31]|uniref:Phosphatidate cytidylyltransferase n=1 Tax=Pontibacter aquaedesilientis TaxID=2766980 RepID=A0ABR7XJC4_9BACT|nr:hypothetical protein [Pontibacter aquaedesilientis]MBD1398380.1 hypothetical protein [Pontibacter aquaedesilientis]